MLLIKGARSIRGLLWMDECSATRSSSFTSRVPLCALCSRMAISTARICPSMKSRRVSAESENFSKLECVTITAFQSPVAMRLKSRARFDARELGVCAMLPFLQLGQPRVPDPR